MIQNKIYCNHKQHKCKQTCHDVMYMGLRSSLSMTSFRLDNGKAQAYAAVVRRKISRCSFGIW
ncbi:MAG: hypothetical protein ACLRL6_14975 [Clostridium sp.]